MTDSKIQTIQDIYAAFGRGDVEFILDQLTDDIDWASEADGTSAPWHGVRHGKDGVVAFFTELAKSSEVTEFTPLAFASNEDSVMTVVRYGLQARDTGKSGVMDLHHWWRFRDGKVCYYRGTEDTALTARLLAHD